MCPFHACHVLPLCCMLRLYQTKLFHVILSYRIYFSTVLLHECTRTMCSFGYLTFFNTKTKAFLSKLFRVLKEKLEKISLLEMTSE
jgi:hypothetical protein